MLNRIRAVRAHNHGSSRWAPFKSHKVTVVTLLAGLGVLFAPAAYAQGESGLRLEEIIVTAQKKGAGESIQDVPLAVTAFSGDLLDQLQVRNVQDLTQSVPNVAIDSSGTVKGLANFAIRGLGVTSSVPTIDPTVGTFVDGVYLGTNFGVILDNFDLEGIEVLRGPQGILFGRNVTGGAILVNTRKPSHEYSARVKAGVETGLQTTIAGSVTGSLSEDVSGKLVAYYKDDQGFYTNLANGNDDFGGDETYFVRAALGFTPNDRFDAVLRFETGSVEGDGPPNQNVLFADEHDVNIDNEGLTDIAWDNINLELNYQVGFGDGTITSISGWRQVDNISISDIDSNPTAGFDFGANLAQDQFSTELRYSGTFNDGRWRATAGLYYFTQDILYREQRELLGGALAGTFGGNQGTVTWGVFLSNDISINDRLTLNLGARYTEEEKDVESAFFQPNIPNQPCTFNPSETCNFDFVDEDDWQNLSPKVGLEYQLNDNAKVYGSWSQGFRSGGYSLRNASATALPGPVDEEEQTSIELGFKGDWLDGRLRTNLAIFSSDIDDVQRIVTTVDPGVGLVQTARNTADASIDGLEFEVTTFLSDGVLFSAFLGLLDGEYTRVIGDLNNDGVVDAGDSALRLPLLADVSYGFQLDYTTQLGNGELGFLASYTFRDEAESTDANDLGTTQDERDIVNASVRYVSPNEKWTASLYVKNLTDEVINQTISNLPPVVGGGTIQPLKKGRVVGFEVTYDF